MMPLNYISRVCIRGYKVTKSPEMINHLLYTDNTNMFSKNEKDLATDTNNKNIHTEYKNGIWYWKMCHDHNDKWKLSNNRRNRIAKSRKNQSTRSKGKLQVLGILKACIITPAEMKEKIRKMYLRRTRKLLEIKALQVKSHQRDKHLSGILFKNWTF